jgi:hypothetical protein
MSSKAGLGFSDFLSFLTSGKLLVQNSNAMEAAAW